ncbi:MAG TPA: hypothetical protein VH331_16515 [Allosphingosinicella sp.]|jgi:hypothetical protein|nr:hypothetical protein [Allosphingosinicella sp.]
MPDEEPMKEDLVGARERIIAQLDELNFRANASWSRTGGPPDYGGLIAELQEELREIDALLNIRD